MLAMRSVLLQLTMRLNRLAATSARASGGTSPEQTRWMRNYVALALESKELHDDRLRMNERLLRYQQLIERLGLLLEDYARVYSRISTRRLDAPAAHSPPKFQELSESSVQQAIRRCSLNARLCLTRARSPDNQDSAFGWLVSWDLSDPSDIFVSLTKKLPGVTAQQAITRAWDINDNPALHQHLGSFKQRVLQVIPRRAYVEALNMPLRGLYEGKTRPSCMMSFKVKTGHGFAIGVSTLSQRQCYMGHSGEGEFAQFSTWNEIVDGLDGCCVTTISYRGQYDTGDTPHRRFLNFLSTARHWEELIMAQPLKMLV